MRAIRIIEDVVRICDDRASGTTLRLESQFETTEDPHARRFHLRRSALRALSDLVSQGKALYRGTSEWPPERILEAWNIAGRNHLHKPVMEQPEYNLLHRWRVEHEYAPLYRAIGLGLTTWSPLASGLLQ